MSTALHQFEVALDCEVRPCHFFLLRLGFRGLTALVSGDLSPIMVKIEPRSSTRKKWDTSKYFFLTVVVFAIVTLLRDANFDPAIVSLETWSARDQNDNLVKKDSLASLSCEAYGGPSAEYAKEMIYWRDFPEDSKHVSPFHRRHTVDAKTPKEFDTEYLTFEPDVGGWNNIRMAMESVVTLAMATGRTLVLPPEKKYYLIAQDKKGKQRAHFGFQHFYHMEHIHKEHVGLDIITMKEYLEREKGNFRDQQTGKVSHPPNRRTDWDGASEGEIDQLFRWLRSVSLVPNWNPDVCLAAFPASSSHEDVQQLVQMEKVIQQQPPRWQDYVGKPVPVDAPALDRLQENVAERTSLCIYNEDMQAAQFLHFQTDLQQQARLLVHFYAFLFFASWEHDLWMKRFVRDHLRYVDEIQCAAARVIAALRERSRKNRPSDNGEYDSFHIRRGDFQYQYKMVWVSAEEILSAAKKKIAKGTTVFIATDERDKSFFKPLVEYYDVVFLDDVLDQLESINSNYYGMIDQLVASRGRAFFGCWFSTFTGYIMRLRGYRADKDKATGYESGITNSWYYTPPEKFEQMQQFHPVKQPFFSREYPTSWRLLDTFRSSSS